MFSDRERFLKECGRWFSECERTSLLSRDLAGCKDHEIEAARQRMKYDGCWTIRAISGECRVIHTASEDPDAPGREDGTRAYTDVVEVPGEIKWVLLGENLAKEKSN